VALAGLAVVVAAGVVVLWPQQPSSPISRQNFGRIHVGMTQTEVEAILGPPGDYSTSPTEYDDSASIREGISFLGNTKATTGTRVDWKPTPGALKTG
jgi:hypothetical protein